MQIINSQQSKPFSIILQSETYSGKISGNVFEDANSNGIKDTGEKTMAGWKVCIDSNNNGTCEENVEKFIVTNNDGYYKFSDLVKGNYTIIQVPKNNWKIISPLAKKYQISLNNGENYTNLNFQNEKIHGNKGNK